MIADAELFGTDKVGQATELHARTFAHADWPGAVPEQVTVKDAPFEEV